MYVHLCQVLHLHISNTFTVIRGPYQLLYIVAPCLSLLTHMPGNGETYNNCRNLLSTLNYKSGKT